MIVHLLFSHVLGNVTGFVYVCIDFIWWMHDCPPVVLVLFDGCMIVHLLFSHVFGNVTGFVYVWKLSWCMLVLVHCLVLMALFSFFPDNSTKLTFSLWATQNDLMYWFCMVCFTETFNLSHKYIYIYIYIKPFTVFDQDMLTCYDVLTNLITLYLLMYVPCV